MPVRGTVREIMETEMGKFKRGTLRSGRRGRGKGRKVASRAQAIAIGLSEARRAGADVPPPPGNPKRGHSSAIRALRGRRR